MLLTWCCTVFSVITSSAAICWLLLPAVMSRSTSTSRAERPSGRAAFSPAGLLRAFDAPYKVRNGPNGEGAGAGVIEDRQPGARNARGDVPAGLLPRVGAGDGAWRHHQRRRPQLVGESGDREGTR